MLVSFASRTHCWIGLIVLVIGVSNARAFNLIAPAQSPAGEFQTVEEPSEFVVDIERGERLPIIDSVGWVLGIPKKLLLWDHRADNHEVSDDTIEETAGYLAENEVEGVKVRVNQYDPIGEWRRLAHNDRVGFGWRATVGSVYTLGYSIVPGRLFGNDWYNPYTDSVHVYSDIPSLAMEQAAHAKDVHERTHPGFYSAMQLLPFVGLVHEARSKQSVFDHIDEHGTVEERAEARRVLQPQLGSEIGGQLFVFVPQADAVLQLTGAAVGHVVGRYQASQITSHAADENLTSASYTSVITGNTIGNTAGDTIGVTAPVISLDAMPSLLGPMNAVPTSDNPWLFTPQD